MQLTESLKLIEKSLKLNWKSDQKLNWESAHISAGDKQAYYLPLFKTLLTTE